jgi:hypothetical protein
MSNELLHVSAALLACVVASCSGSQPTPAAPAETAAPEAAAAPAPASASPAANMPPASASAKAETPAAPADPMLAGLTGEDLDWGKKCVAGEGSYCTKFGNVAEFKDKDFAKALVWYKKGCEATKQEPVCCMGQARLTIQGQGTTADVAAGIKLWTDMCSVDIGRDSCSELASAYEKGQNGVKKDPKKAKETYGKICDKWPNDAGACKKAGKKPPKT